MWDKKDKRFFAFISTLYLVGVFMMYFEYGLKWSWVWHSIIYAFEIIGAFIIGLVIVVFLKARQNLYVALCLLFYTFKGLYYTNKIEKLAKNTIREIGGDLKFKSTIKRVNKFLKYKAKEERNSKKFELYYRYMVINSKNFKKAMEE